MISKGIPGDIDLTIDNDFRKGVSDESILYKNYEIGQLPWTKDGYKRCIDGTLPLSFRNEWLFNSNNTTRFQIHTGIDYRIEDYCDDELSLLDIDLTDEQIKELIKNNDVSFEVSSDSLYIIIDWSSYRVIQKIYGKALNFDNKIRIINSEWGTTFNQYNMDVDFSKTYMIDITPKELKEYKLTSDEVNGNSMILGRGKELAMKIKKKTFLDSFRKSNGIINHYHQSCWNSIDFIDDIKLCCRKKHNNESYYDANKVFLNDIESICMNDDQESRAYIKAGSIDYFAQPVYTDKGVHLIRLNSDVDELNVSFTDFYPDEEEHLNGVDVAYKTYNKSKVGIM